jgi:hypothetical protein
VVGSVTVALRIALGAPRAGWWHRLCSRMADRARGCRHRPEKAHSPARSQTVATFETMFIARKQGLLTQFLKFGVDDQGTIIPILRRSKGHAAKSNTEYRPLQIPWKHQLAAH